jgi:hypothetical protein
MNERTTRWGATALLTAAVVASASAVWAQSPADSGSGLLLGPLTVHPEFVVREAGWDSNIFNEPGLETEDRTATLTGRAQARMRVGLVQVEGTGAADYMYFQRYTGERSLNRFVSTRVQPQFVRFRPFVIGSYRRTRDRANNEIDVRAPRTEYEQGGGIETLLSTRLTLETAVRRQVIRFDEGESFRDIPLATRLNRTSNTAAVSMRYELTPLTSMVLATSFVRDEFAASPERNMDTLHATAGVSFAPDAVVRGRAILGFRDLRSRGPLAVPSRGPTAAVELSYTLLDRTIFSGRLQRETTVSVEDNPYYLSTLWSVEIAHNLIGPLDVLARAARERLEYDEVAAFALRGHLDRVATAGGGLALRLGRRTKLSGMYEEIRRRSDLPDVRDYDRRRVYTTISYGF